jgi:hypothetical protein
MRFYQVPQGARFYWAGNGAQGGAYVLKCTAVVAYHISAQRFALMSPLSKVSDVEITHDDPLPAPERIAQAHQQALGLLFFAGLLLLTLVMLVWFWFG